MISRIRTILNREDISASKLAEKMGIQRSSISHILSERNKPSLEFIQKVLDAYPNINSEWLLTGKGGYLKTKTSPVTIEKPKEEKKQEPTPLVETKPISSLFENIKQGTKKKTTKIVTFYDDGTFDEHTPS